MAKWLRFVALMLVTLVLVQPGTVLGAEELTVSAAASLTNAFPELGRLFEKQHPGVKVIFNLAASGALLQQLAQGAPVDIFASADQKTMDQAQENGLVVPASRRNFVSNALVLIVPQDAKLAIAGPKDLLLPAVKRVAVGNPASVPAGRYTKGALTKAGLWEKLQPKFIMGESVRQVLDYVGRGEVDAGFVYATDAAVARGKVKVVATVPGHQPIVYPAALVAASHKKALGQQFLEFLATPESVAILSKYGFGKPKTQ
jgi:molybdate transport system substrate-binding protein